MKTEDRKPEEVVVRRPRRPRREGLIKQQIYKWLITIPDSYWEKSKPGSRTGKPDLTGCIRWGHYGQYVGLEVKTIGGYPTKIQLHTLEKLKQAGAVVAVVRSLNEVKQLLQRKGLVRM